VVEKNKEAMEDSHYKAMEGGELEENVEEGYNNVQSENQD
jgi:hypothetical protein